MNKRSERLTSALSFAILVGATALVFTPGSSAAHSGHVFQAALANPVTVDGVLSPGEWADASTNTFNLCSGSPARILVKNDATYLYVAVEVQNVRWRFGGPPGSGNDFLNLTFDNQHNGSRDVGDNTWNVRGGDGLTVDGYDPNGFGWNYDDTSTGGTTDFVAGVTHSNPLFDGVGTYTVEYKGSLDSADDAYDFSLAPGQTVGFYFASGIISCPGYWPSALAYADIVIAATDTEPPVLTLELEPSLLWPPNHKLVSVLASPQAQDAVDESPRVILASITSNEPDAGTGAEDLPDDIEAEIGTADVEFALRSERAEEGNGRTYTVCYEATDASGNSTRTCAIVEVPHDRRGRASLQAASPSWSLTVLGSGLMPARSIAASSVTVGTESSGRVHPQEVPHYVDADGDGHEDAIFELADGLSALDVARGDPFYARWEASGLGYLAKISPGSVTAVGSPAPVTLEASAWPNPGRRYSTLSYALPYAGLVRLRIYDVAGHQVACLVDRWQPAGRHAARFLGGGGSGLYLYRLDWEGKTASGKFAIVQ